MSEPIFSPSDIHELATEIRSARGGTPAELEAAKFVAIARIAVKAARDFTNRRADQLALRLDAAEKQIRERDEQLQRHKEHLARLQTKVATLELLAKR